MNAASMMALKTPKNSQNPGTAARSFATEKTKYTIVASTAPIVRPKSMAVLHNTGTAYCFPMGRRDFVSACLIGRRGTSALEPSKQFFLFVAGHVESRAKNSRSVDVSVAASLEIVSVVPKCHV